MPFNMFKAFSGSRSRTHRGDPTIYADYPQGYPPAAGFQPEPMIQSQQVLRRPSIKRREPVFTPLPSRTPTDAEEYNEGYIRVDSPDAVMRGALNARPAKIDSAFPPLGPGLESPLSETLSEREHHGRMGGLHDVPRLLDRPPQLQHAGSFHSGHGERVNPEDPMVMAVSPSLGSGSDHTIEALRTPLSVHPSDRVIPPLPRHYAGGYAPGSRSPTDIYNNHGYEVVHSHHDPEVYRDRYGRTSDYGKDRPIYYIIPGGMNVIFQDEHGHEITRVGDFSGRSRPSRPGPFVVQDEHGRELYRYDGYDRGSRRGYSEPQIVQIDAYPSSGYHPRDRSYSSRNYRSDYAPRQGYDYRPDHREYRNYGEYDRRDHRNHRHRGYSEHPGYDEYRDHRGYRNPDEYRDYRSYGGDREYGGYREHGGYREYDGYRDHGRHRDRDGYGEHRGYREHGDYKLHEAPEVYPPSRVSSRASHRTHTSQVSMERLPHHYSSSVHDDRRSGRDYASSHASARHLEDEADISSGLQALRI